MRHRLPPAQRRALILTAACRVARDKGLAHVNHGNVSKQCTVHTNVKTVRHYFNDQMSLWLAVLDEVPELVAQGKELGLHAGK